MATATKTATKAQKKEQTAAENTARAVSKENQAIRAELSTVEAEAFDGKAKLSDALTWRIKMSTHVVTLASGTVRSYITIDSGMPRDIRVALVEGKAHSIQVRVVSRDKAYETHPRKKPSLTPAEEGYNAKMTDWSVLCGKEAAARLQTIMSAVGGWDDLWAAVCDLERNDEIAKSEVFFSL